MERKLNNILFKTVPAEWDVYFDMALVMLDEIMKNNAAGKKAVMIVPVGPTAQYPILAKLVNQLKVSLKDVYFFNMDEYMMSPTETVSPDDPISFHYRMGNPRIAQFQIAQISIVTQHRDAVQADAVDIFLQPLPCDRARRSFQSLLLACQTVIVAEAAEAAGAVAAHFRGGAVIVIE